MPAFAGQEMGAHSAAGACMELRDMVLLGVFAILDAYVTSGYV